MVFLSLLKQKIFRLKAIYLQISLYYYIVEQTACLST